MNPYGFDWGPMSVTRCCTLPRPSGEAHVLQVKTAYGSIDIYVSPTGRSIRIFGEDEYLGAPKPAPRSSATNSREETS